MSEVEQLRAELARLRTQIIDWNRAQEERTRRFESTVWLVAGAVATGVGALGPLLVRLLTGS